MFLDHLQELPPFLEWIQNAIATTVKEGKVIERDVVHMSMPPTLEVQSYWTMWKFGSHIHVSSIKEHLTTCDNGVITTFEQECVSWPNDQLLQNWSMWDGLKKILELNYGVLTMVVLLCNWLKTNMSRIMQ